MCVCVDMHGAMVQVHGVSSLEIRSNLYYAVLIAMHVQVLPIYSYTCTVVFKVVNVVYTYIPMHH